MKMNPNSIYVRVVLLILEHEFSYVMSGGINAPQISQFVPLVCNYAAVCATSQPFISFSAPSVTSCTTQCYFAQNQPTPCVGFNYRQMNNTCDLFTQTPGFFANNIAGCQYYQLANSANNNCTQLPGLQSVTSVAALSGTYHVLATALLNGRLFVTRFGVSEVSVYDSESLQLLTRITSSELSTELFGLATSTKNNCLFIADHQNSRIHRVDISMLLTASDIIITSGWPVSTPAGLSITNGGNILVVSNSYTAIEEYTPDGLFVRGITDRNSLWQTIEMSNGVCAFTVRNMEMSGVCTAFTNGTVIKCFGSAAGSTMTQMSEPRVLAVDARGYIYVTDLGNNRILIVDPSLTEARQLQLPVGIALMEPLALSIDESRGRLYVGEDSGQCRVLVFDGI